jgi:hypothetical protein
MRHLASRTFWNSYDALPKEVQELARKQFRLLKENPAHPSLHFKKVGRFWSVRIGAQLPRPGNRSALDRLARRLRQPG